MTVATKTRRKPNAKSVKEANVDPNDVKNGDLMAFTYWAIVTGKDRPDGDTRLKCKTLHSPDGAGKFSVTGDELIKSAYSADRFNTTEKLTKTAIVEVLANAHNVPFTVEFVKADGNKRVLRGQLIGVDQKNLGYIDVEDLDLPKGKNFRLVDCRTIKSVIVRGVKYYVA